MFLTSGEARRRGLLRAIATVLLLGIAMVLLMPPRVFVTEQVLAADQNLLDLSWSMDIANRTSWGEWAGRDYIFTAGPLYQVTHGLGLFVGSGDFASQLRFHDVPERIITVLVVWGLLCLMEAPWRWRAVVFGAWTLFLFSGAQGWVGVKQFAGFYLVALCGRELLSERPAAPRRLFLYAVSAPLMLWYSFDTGIYTFAALLLLGLGLAVVAARGRSAWMGLGMVVGGFVVIGVMLPKLLGAPNLWRDSLDMAVNYAVLMAFPLSTANLIGLLLVDVVAAGIFVWALRRIRREGVDGELRILGAIAGAAVFAFIVTRAGFTRSDPGHVGQAMMPLFFLISGMLVLRGVKQGKRAAWLLLLLPLTFYRSANMTSPVAAVPGALRQLTSAAQMEWGPARLKVEQLQVIDAQAALKRDRAPALLIWPFASVIADIMGRHNPWYTVQPYAAHTRHLEEQSLIQMEKWPELPVLFYGKEGELSEVPNLTRTPLIFKYLLENFTVVSRVNDVTVLRRRKVQERLVYASEPLLVAAGEFRPGGGVLSIAPTRATSLCGEADFMELNLRSAPTSLFPIRKPGRVILKYQFSDGTSLSHDILLSPDGEVHPVLVSALPARSPDFYLHFSLIPAAPSHRRVTRLELSWAPIDRLSVRPAFIKLESAKLLTPRQRPR